MRGVWKQSVMFETEVKPLEFENQHMGGEIRPGHIEAAVGAILKI